MSLFDSGIFKRSNRTHPNEDCYRCAALAQHGEASSSFALPCRSPAAAGRRRVRKLKVTPGRPVPLCPCEIVLINRGQHSAFGLKQTVLGQAILELRGETSGQVV